MDNVPVHVNHGANAGRHGSEAYVPGEKKKRGKGRKKIVTISIGLIVLIAVIVLGVLMFYRSSVGSLIDGGKYQAVFFTNGQVYFGKLQTVNGNYFRLTNIFYLQTKTPDATNPQATSTDATADVQLIKLGDEIHGPNDEMIINNDQVLFFENLKAESKVTQSIITYQKKG
ncbi:hypothetical protein BH10PAT4_BH10PAT4_0780 [soil metagenome]